MDEAKARGGMTIHDRVSAVLRGEKPDRIPFIDRFDVWYACHSRGGTLPEAFQGMSVAEIHRAVGMGQQKFLVPYALRLRGVEVVARFNGEEFYRETNPVLEYFCGTFDFMDYETPGVTTAELLTPVGKLRVQYILLEENVATGTEHYIKEHLIKSDEDYRTAEYLVEHAALGSIIVLAPRRTEIGARAFSAGDKAFVSWSEDSALMLPPE